MATNLILIYQIDFAGRVMFADIVRNGAYRQPFGLMEYGFPRRFSQSHALNDLLESRIVTQKVIERIDVDKREKESSGSSFLKRAIEIL